MFWCKETDVNKNNHRTKIQSKSHTTWSHLKYGTCGHFNWKTDGRTDGLTGRDNVQLLLHSTQTFYTFTCMCTAMVAIRHNVWQANVSKGLLNLQEQKHMRTYSLEDFRFSSELPGDYYYYRCGRNNSHISKGNYKQMVRVITKNFLFSKCRYQKVFLL
jgi:hypothetical protein